ncbi:MAG: 50S ribosomal protein L9 [Lachnospiraceae bacterium]|jgi:large subunit ribosomal protein L9|nr:50S ribosomal protein L9 [Lachnospiraceae bacterium]
MKVILLEDIKAIGKKNQVVNATDGYARNFLFPKKLAVEANAENMQKLKDKQKSEERKKQIEIENAKEIAKKMEKMILKLKVKAGENGKTFGGVTSKEIAEELKKEYKIEIDKKKIDLKETIKLVGRFSVNIKLYEGVNQKLTIDIEAE